jgi:hypothetical protein
MQHGNREDADRAVEVEESAEVRVREDLVGVAQVSADHGGVRVAGEEVRGGAGGDRVAFDMQDAYTAVVGLCDLVDTAGVGEARAEVEELSDADSQHVLHSPRLKRPVGPSNAGQSGHPDGACP